MLTSPFAQGIHSCTISSEQKRRLQRDGLRRRLVLIEIGDM